MPIFNLSWLFGKKPSMPPRIPMPPVPPRTMPPVTTTAITNAITNPFPKPTSTGSGLFASLHNFMLFGHQPQGIPQGTSSGYGRKADSPPKTYTYVAGGYTVNNEHPRGATWMALSTDGSLGYWVNGYVPAGTVTHSLGEIPSRSSRIGNM